MTIKNKRIIVLISIPIVILIIGALVILPVLNKKQPAKSNKNIIAKENLNSPITKSDKVNYGTSASGYEIVGQWEINSKDYPDEYFYEDKDFDDSKQIKLGTRIPDSFSVNSRMIDLHQLLEAKSTNNIAKYLEDISKELKITSALYVSKEFENKYENTKEKNIPAEVFKKELEDLSSNSLVNNQKKFHFETNSGSEINLVINYDYKQKTIYKFEIDFEPYWKEPFGIPTVEKAKDELIYNYDDIKLSVIGGTRGVTSGLAFFYYDLPKEIEL